MAKKIERVRATDIAATIGRQLAAAMALAGLLSHPFLLLIAFTIYLGARAEASHVPYSALIGDLPVRDAMLDRVTCVRAIICKPFATDRCKGCSKTFLSPIRQENCSACFIARRS